MSYTCNGGNKEVIVAIKTVQRISVPLGANKHTLGTAQPYDAIGGHFNVLTSYKVGKTQLTTD